MDEYSDRPRGLWVLWQKIFAGAVAAVGFMGLVFAYKLSAPGAPVLYYWASEAAMFGAALALTPAIYFRIPDGQRKLVIFAVIGAFFMLVSASGRVIDAYGETPEGEKEAAIQAESDRQQDAKEEARRQAAADAEINETKARLEANSLAMCKNLVDQIVDGEKVIEINEVAVKPNTDQLVTCTGDAFTSSGTRAIEFGAEKTPQGQFIRTVKYP